MQELYIFEKIGSVWTQVDKFSASDAFENQYFGYSVDIDGDRIVVGGHDPTNSSLTKGVYVYEWNGSSWGEIKLGAIGNAYGRTVAISGNRIVAGAYSYSGYRGAVYLYEWNGSAWVETIQQASDVTAGAFFGSSVSIDGDRFLVGAYGEDSIGSDAGSAYLYEWNGNTWIESKYLPEAGSYRTHFGNAVDIENNKFIVGGYYNDGNTFSNAGFIHIYEWDGGSWQKTRVDPSNGVAGDQFGANVKISSDKFVVGANTNHSAYIYDWSGSTWDESITTLSGEYFTFGKSLEIVGEDVFVGLERDDTTAGSAGSVVILGYGGIPGCFCSSSALTDLDTNNNAVPFRTYWNWLDNLLYVANAAGDALVAFVAPSNTVKDTVGITGIDGSATPGMVYFDDESKTIYIADANGDLQPPSATNAGDVGSMGSATEGVVYFDTTTKEITVGQADGSRETPAEPSDSCLEQ